MNRYLAIRRQKRDEIISQERDEIILLDKKDCTIQTVSYGEYEKEIIQIDNTAVHNQITSDGEDEQEKIPFIKVDEVWKDEAVVEETSLMNGTFTYDSSTGKYFWNGKEVWTGDLLYPDSKMNMRQPEQICTINITHSDIEVQYMLKEKKLSLSELKKLGIGNIFKSKMRAHIDEIWEYYLAHFALINSQMELKIQEEISCKVYIDLSKDINNIKENLKRYMAIEEKVRKIFENMDDNVQGKALEELVIGYLLKLKSELLDSVVDSEELEQQRQTVLDSLDNSDIEEEDKNRIRTSIFKVEKIVRIATQALGYFRTSASSPNQCEIFLHYDLIADICADYIESASSKTPEFQSLSEESSLIIDFMAYVLSHEMFHFFHYVDVRLNNGIWDSDDEKWIKRDAVIESLAEYFALSYSKQQLENKVVEYIRNILNIDDFPEDGGYSGAIILEQSGKNEQNEQVGKRNSLYCNIYQKFFTDVESAFDSILDYKVRNRQSK